MLSFLYYGMAYSHEILWFQNEWYIAILKTKKKAKKITQNIFYIASYFIIFPLILPILAWSASQPIIYSNFGSTLVIFIEHTQQLNSLATGPMIFPTSSPLPVKKTRLINTKKHNAV